MASGQCGGFKDVPGGKYLVLRRDGSVPDWSWFVLGAADPHAPAALAEYGRKAIDANLQAYGIDVLRLSLAFSDERKKREDAGKKKGDPEAPPHRQDDPLVVALMRGEVTWTDIRAAAEAGASYAPERHGAMARALWPERRPTT